MNNLIEINDNQNNTINYSYDSLGRKIQLNDPDMGTWYYTYDPSSNLISQEDNSGITTTYNYDSLNRISNTSSLDSWAKYTYDLSRKGSLSVIKTGAIEKIYYYDQRGRVIAEQKIIDGLSFNITYGYDAMDRLSNKKLPDGKVISYGYDNQGLLETIQNVLPNIDYNLMNQPTIRSYNNGLTTSFQYNDDNFRLIRLQTSDKQDISYTYDDIGNILQIADTKNSNFEYDDLDRLINAQKTDEFEVVYDYDSIGNLKNILYDQADSNESDYEIEYIYSEPVHTPVKIICIGNGCNFTNYPSFMLSLKKGWNLISMPLEPVNNSLEQLGDYEEIFTFNNSDKKYYVPKYLELEKGYWLKSDKNKTLNIKGTSVTNLTYNLSLGWNLIGFPLLQPNWSNSTILNYFITRILSYNDTGWQSVINESTLLIPGKGYWVNVTGGGSRIGG
jgi:YD repeat-containing protein